MSIKFTLTHIKSFTKQQAYDDAYKMKKTKNNSVIECDLQTFAAYLSQAHSFHPGAMNLFGDENISQELFLSTDLLVADVDHADFTIEDILNISAENDLNVAMIYESLSSTDEKRKYRVIYQIERLYDKVAFSKAQKFLIYVFGKEYVESTVVDTSCFDPGRLYFTAKRIVYINDVMTDVKAVLEKCEALDIDAKHKQLVEINAPLKKAEQERKKAEKNAKKAAEQATCTEIYDLEEIDLNVEELYRGRW